jgi:hypothetical protein
LILNNHFLSRIYYFIVIAIVNENKLLNKQIIMKKIIAGTLVGCALFTSGAFANETPVPTLYNSSIELTSEPSVKDIMKQNEIIIRNNKLKSDYEYNNIHYYTTKMTSSDIIIPKDIQEKAKKIYFLVEEGQSRIYYEDAISLKASNNISQVKKEYNYKIVDFQSGKKEYIFNNKDLVKDF